jgi:hypothetical protein
MHHYAHTPHLSTVPDIEVIGAFTASKGGNLSGFGVVLQATRPKSVSRRNVAFMQISLPWSSSYHPLRLIFK